MNSVAIRKRAAVEERSIFSSLLVGELVGLELIADLNYY
jgi:hypothetical protein